MSSFFSIAANTPEMLKAAVPNISIKVITSLFITWFGSGFVIAFSQLRQDYMILYESTSGGGPAGFDLSSGNGINS